MNLRALSRSGEPVAGSRPQACGGRVSSFPVREESRRAELRRTKSRLNVTVRFKQLKEHHTLGRIPTRHFFANETYFHLLLLAYNLVNKWFKRFCLLAGLQTATLQTTPHHRIPLMPPQLRGSQNRPRLVLPSGGAREVAWKYALHQIETLNLWKPILHAGFRLKTQRGVPSK